MSQQLAKSALVECVRLPSQKPRGHSPKHTVDLHLAVRDDGLDLALLLQILQALAGQRTIDLESVDEGSDGHEAV